MHTSAFLRYIITGLLLLIALLFGRHLWNDNMDSPWTRDGRINANIIHIAPDVSGIVTSVAVQDNQFVHRGDVLFSIDKSRYGQALAQTEATLSAQQAEKTMRSKEAARRNGLDASIVTSENRESAASLASIASAKYEAAAAARDTAKLNLERTDVRAPVDGYVSNLHVYAGDFVAIGVPQLAVIDSNSYYVSGYFEETKLQYLAVNDPVEIHLMSGGPVLQGQIESISRGITDRDATTGKDLLADINPTFNWVRLAQRIPVHIRLDGLAAKQYTLVAGMTCTVIVKSHKS